MFPRIVIHSVKFYSKTRHSLKYLLDKGVDIEMAQEIIEIESKHKLMTQVDKLKTELMTEKDKLKTELVESTSLICKNIQYISKIETLEKENKRLEARLLHSQSSFSIRSLLERMEMRMGRSRKSRGDKWADYLAKNSDSKLVESFKSCFLNFEINYSPEAASAQIGAAYASMSAIIHAYDTVMLAPDDFVLSVPPNTSRLQLCLIKYIITSPDALGFDSIKFKEV